MRARLQESVLIAPEVRHFVFDVPAVDTLEFRPGQFVSFTEPRDGKKVTRAYSIAGMPGGNRFELCLNRVREGLLSPWLFEMRPGDEVDMLGPLGYFVPRQPFAESVLVATGTGIAPFRAFLSSREVLDSSSRISLLFGTRHEDGLLYRTELEELERSREGFSYVPTLTRPESGWQGRTGRVQAHLDELLDGRTDLDVYLCGLKAMVDDVRATLKLRGFDRSRIRYEKYD